MKKVVFTFNSQVIHEVIANELDTETIVSYKSALAASRGLDCELIEVETTSGEHFMSDLSVRKDGALMFHPKHRTYPKYVDCPVPSMDITHEELFDEFLGLISNGNIDNAITFL